MKEPDRENDRNGSSQNVCRLLKKKDDQKEKVEKIEKDIRWQSHKKEKKKKGKGYDLRLDIERGPTPIAAQ